MDPHKRSVTIEVIARDETVLDRGRFATDRDGAAAMLRFAGRWPQRTWAIEGCNGIGRHVANRLLRDGEDVVDVPPKLSARARVFLHRTGPQDRRHRRAPGRIGGDEDAAVADWLPMSAGTPGWRRSA